MGFWPAEAEAWIERDGLRVYPDQPQSAAELVQRSAAEAGSATAIVEAGSGLALTYEELWEASGRVAGGLQVRGVEPGDRVAFLMANCADVLVGLLAVWRAGAVAAMLNTKYTSAELAGLLRQCEPKLVLAQPEWAAKIDGRDVVTDLSGLQGALSPAEPRAQDPALLMYTSGTTGMSKGALQSHLNLVSAVETWRRCAEIDAGATTVVAAPMFHATGLNGQSLPVLASGGRVTILPRFDADALVELLAVGRATFFHASPTIYTLALRAANGRKARGLVTCVAGGSFVSRSLVEAACSFAPGVDFRISYGMTETSSPAVLTPRGRILDRPGDAIGVAVPVDEVATDEAGEILFRGATVIRGYDRNPEANARAYDGDWLRSGDLGEIDEDGFVTVSDRIKDIVNRGAEKISTLEVEDVLSTHPAVLEAAVVAAPDDVYGEVPYAFVVADGALDLAELRAFARKRLAGFKVPAAVVVVDELPRNPGGKLLKEALRAELRR